MRYSNLRRDSYRAPSLDLSMTLSKYLLLKRPIPLSEEGPPVDPKEYGEAMKALNAKTPQGQTVKALVGYFLDEDIPFRDAETRLEYRHLVNSYLEEIKKSPGLCRYLSQIADAIELHLGKKLPRERLVDHGLYVEGAGGIESEIESLGRFASSPSRKKFTASDWIVILIVVLAILFAKPIVQFLQGLGLM